MFQLHVVCVVHNGSFAARQSSKNSGQKHIRVYFNVAFIVSLFTYYLQNAVRFTHRFIVLVQIDYI